VVEDSVAERASGERAFLEGLGGELAFGVVEAVKGLQIELRFFADQVVHEPGGPLGQGDIIRPKGSMSSY